MIAPSLSRVRIIASLCSLIIHALALGALLLFARLHTPGFSDPAPAIALVEIERHPAQPAAAPRQQTPSRAIAETSIEAAPPAPIATELVSTTNAIPATAPYAPPSAEDDAYMRAVWMRLAAHRPRAFGGQRTARVAFALSPGGELRYVRLNRSSGSSSFDDACMNSVRDAAPFPRAPAGASESLLVFVVPISTRL